MTDRTPPPERPLPEDARARMRAELLEHAHEHRSRAARWAVPLGAAAAVAVVAGLGFWAVNIGDNEPATTPVGGGESSSPVPSPETTVASSEVVPTSAPESTVTVGTQSCEEEMKHVLRGAELAVEVEETSFWVKGDRFVQCDRLGGRTTIHQPQPLTPRDHVSTYAVSTLYDGQQVIRSAGGVVSEGAEEVMDVAYTFPDGHTEHATTVTDDQGRTWWRMVYAHDDAGGNETRLPEIEVTVSLSGVQQTYSLRWGQDTCAQANHGC